MKEHALPQFSINFNAFSQGFWTFTICVHIDTVQTAMPTTGKKQFSKVNNYCEKLKK